MPVKATIILATDTASSLPIFGQTAINRLILLSRKLSISKIDVIGNEKGVAAVNSNMTSLATPRIVENANGLKKALLSFDIKAHDRILVMKANLVIDRGSLTKLIDRDNGVGIAEISADGKGASGGAYLVSQADLLFLLRNLWLIGMPDKKTDQSIHRLAGTDGLPFIMSCGREQVQIAEKRLIRVLARQTYASDSLLSRHFDRHISRAISTRLVSTSLTPNQITLIGVTIGMAGAYLLSQPGYFYQLIGAFLFLFCVIVDGVDGEVARLKLQDSIFGHYLDVITDNLVHAAVFAGIAYGLHRDTGDPIYLQALWLMLGGFGLCIVAVWQCILRRTEKELERSPRLMRFMALMTNRDFAYLVFLLAVIHRLNWFLMGAAIGTYLFAVILWILSYFDNTKLRLKT